LAGNGPKIFKGLSGIFESVFKYMISYYLIQNNKTDFEKKRNFMFAEKGEKGIY
jgi:hypothetical protein